MVEFLQTPTAKLVVSIAGLLVLTVIGYYVVLRFRGETEQDETYSDLLTNFRELRQEGLLNEEEYRTIRTDLESKLSQQVVSPSQRRDRKQDI